jgi:hypothetical protein
LKYLRAADLKPQPDAPKYVAPSATPSLHPATHADHHMGRIAALISSSSSRFGALIDKVTDLSVILRRPSGK